MPSLKGVVPTLTPQGVGNGDRPKWHGHRAGEKGGTGALANIVEHAAGRRGKPAVSLTVGVGPGAWLWPSILTGCSLTLGLGAFGWGGGSPVGAGMEPGAWVQPRVLTGCGLMLGLGAFGWGGGSCT